MITKFKDSAEINQFFENWFDYSELDRKETMKQLMQSGQLVAIAPRPESELSACPLHKHPLAKPCGLTSCQFFIKAPHSFNCTINCLSQTKGAKLSPQETATLLGKPTTAIAKITEMAVKKIKFAVIREKIEQFQMPKYKRMEKHCINCGVPIHDQLDSEMRPDLTLEPHKWGWCAGSKKDPYRCKKSFPNWKFKLERNFDCSFIDVLVAALSCYKTTSAVESIFGIDSSVLSEHWPTVRDRLDYFQ